ncbi:MAG: hypothetical protein DMG64_14190 [Acidobacteria bacterium]|nr:MAG: hypothetical protein DMG63_07390 [Acidobacteriota bacterium]PYY01495.1 MAG: hypothetical protein DMG64_14190 [Acidobacteriota bacterium]PYY23840.1 MAG: hypothetical protein DMG62_06435 [Acidobacteriota bacterium]
MGTSASPIGRDEESGSDQRQSARRVVSEPIRLELQPDREVWIQDLGEGGLGIASSSLLELGMPASLRFELPETGSVIDATGVITWSGDDGRAGIRFTRIEPASTAALRKWLNSGANTHPSHSDGAHVDNDLSRKIAALREVADLQAIISTEHLETSTALDVVVRRMAELTRATGAAIALREGQDVFCQASFGNAPDVGVKLSSSSLSGECLRSGTLVMLEDSENDSRVNPEVCRSLNFRSLLIMPIHAGTEIVGIAEVLSPDPHNFEGGDILVVSFLTDLIASVAAPPKEISAPEYTPFDVHEALEPFLVPHLEPLPGAIMPSAATAIAPPSAQRAPVSSLRVEQTAPAQQKPEHFEGGMHIRMPARGTRISFIGILLAGVLLVLGYIYYRNSRAAAQTGNHAPVVGPSGSATTTPSPAILPSSNPGSSPNIARGTVSARTIRPASVPPSRTNNAEVTELEVIQGHTVTPKPAAEPAAPELSPMNMADLARGSNALPASIVLAKTATPELGPPPSQGVVPQSQGVVQGKLIKRVLPQYPEMARRAGVSGEVVIAGIIQTDGMLRNLKVLSGSPLLREAALDAARQWRYSPYMLGGKPVEAETRITVSFHQ